MLRRRSQRQEQRPRADRSWLQLLPRRMQARHPTIPSSRWTCSACLSLAAARSCTGHRSGPALQNVRVSGCGLVRMRAAFRIAHLPHRRGNVARQNHRPSRWTSSARARPCRSRLCRSVLTRQARLLLWTFCVQRPLFMQYPHQKPRAPHLQTDRPGPLGRLASSRPATHSAAS